MKALKFLFLGLLVFSAISCQTKKKSDNILDIAYPSDQIELDLADKMKPLRIIQSFPNLGLELLCQRNKKDNICVFSFDRKVKSLNEMIDFLEGEVGVQGARKTEGCP